MCGSFCILVMKQFDAELCVGSWTRREAQHLVSCRRETVYPRQQRPRPKVVAAAEGVGSRLVHEDKAQQGGLQLLCKRLRGQGLHTSDALGLLAANPSIRLVEHVCTGRLA